MVLHFKGFASILKWVYNLYISIDWVQVNIKIGLKWIWIWIWVLQ